MQWGDVPLALFHPLGRPGIGGHVASMAEYMASFRTVAARMAAQREAEACEAYMPLPPSFDASGITSVRA